LEPNGTVSVAENNRMGGENGPRNAIVAGYLGQALGWYGPGEGAGLIGAVVGAIIVLFVYGLVAGGRRRAV
jgi:hypothetical protein